MESDDATPPNPANSRGWAIGCSLLIAGAAIAGWLLWQTSEDGQWTPELSTSRLPAQGTVDFEPFTASATPRPSTDTIDGNAAGQWPFLYGPSQDAIVPEADLRLDWNGESPPLLWQIPAGEGYSSPVLLDDHLILFHRLGNAEVVDCLDPTDGSRRWRFEYPTRYVDRYGYNGGPRSTPILADGRVYTLGAEGTLHALDLQTGQAIWHRNLNQDYRVEQGFFGVGTTPLLVDDLLIINVGGKETEAGIVAIDAATGKTRWAATRDGASYATPRFARIADRDHVFILTEAGLVDLEPATGQVRWSIPFRSKLYESVNATSPLIDGNIVVVSASYNVGSLAIEIQEDGSYRELWRDRRVLESHFSNLMSADGFLYGFSGRHENGCELRCIELRTGKLRWSWDGEVLGRGQMLRIGGRFLLWGERGHLATLAVDPTEPRLLSAVRRPLLTPAPTWPPPAIASGRMFVRNDSKLLAYDLRSATDAARTNTQAQQ